MKKIIALFSLLFVFSCDRATLNVKPAANSGSPRSTDSFWRSECYDNGFGQYNRDYFQFNSKTVSALTIFYGNDIADCESEINGSHQNSYIAPYEDNISRGIWHALSFPNIGEGGSLEIFIYTQKDNNLYRMSINDYYSLSSPDDLDQLQIEDLQEEPMTFEKIEEFPDFTFPLPQ